LDDERSLSPRVFGITELGESGSAAKLLWQSSIEWWQAAHCRIMNPLQALLLKLKACAARSGPVLDKGRNNWKVRSRLAPWGEPGVDAIALDFLDRLSPE